VKRSNEFAVGAAILGAIAVVIAGALWLSGADLKGEDTTYAARFRSVDGLQVGNPVTLRGVRVGKVEAIRLMPNDWVQADFAIETKVDLPARPAVIAASASLFGGWSANIISLEPLPEDPNIRAALLESDHAGGDAWPGATLPDIGQLTAQASRIAGDVAEVTTRIQGAFDSTALHFEPPDRETFAATLETEAMRAATRADFAATQSLGVSGFPTVAASRGEELYLVTSGYVTHDVLEYRLAEIERLTLK
jgi:hypothetical protein